MELNIVSHLRGVPKLLEKWSLDENNKAILLFNQADEPLYDQISGLKPDNGLEFLRAMAKRINLSSTYVSAEFIK
jgi:hypothetical protein